MEPSSNKGSEFDNMLNEPKVKQGRKLSKERIITLVVLAVGIIFLIVGIVLIVISATDKKTEKSSGSSSNNEEPTSIPVPSTCSLSDEAQSSGLVEFLSRVKATYYKLHPYDGYSDPDVTTERIKVEYVAYDPSPSAIKDRTDTALTLLKEINDKIINTDALKPRERKALAQVKHYLQHVFGQPYDVNYYAGDWMMGPNLFCWQPICSHGYGVYNGLGLYHKPYNVSDVERIETKLKTHKEGILQYIENMKMGVRKGMVRSVEDCQAGINSIKTSYRSVSLYNESGVLQEWFVQPLLDPDYYSKITQDIDNEWKAKHGGKNVSETIKEYLVTYLGEPLNKLLRYVEMEHIRHCVPSNVSSGLANLPLKYVWLDGKENKSWPTDPYLPTREPLNGKKAYSQIMSFFTTNAMTPTEVHELGKKQLDIYYPMIVKVAKEVTGESDNQTAITKFRAKLNSSESYFNAEPIPKNESDAEAHRKCSHIEGAKKYCPKRWAAIQLWFAESRKVMSLLEPKTIPMFHFTGDKATTPACPVDLRPDLNPSSGAQSYSRNNADCTNSAKYNIPFFLDNLGPRFQEWSVNAHEARPGHHTQVQGNIEHFHDSCGGVIGWLNSVTFYTAFAEGWGLYAENPLIAEDTDTYLNEPMQKFGMLQWQVWRALRLIVDTGLHYYGLTRDEALEYFSKYAWDDTDVAKKEVTRYQSDPGQATAYMIGQLEIKKARKYSKDELKDMFSLRDFHYQVLAQGSSPLAYLSDHVTRYVACVKDKVKEGCDVILNPPKKADVKKRPKALEVRWPKILKPIVHYK
ncbi:uncharacterized protein LOC144653347 isoform X2 [Oculina patagonica]